MKYNPEIHHRKSIRLKKYDYSQSGAYFITICCQNKECLFGKIENGKIVLNNAGKMADTYWCEIPIHYPFATLDTYTIMPNHIHGIIIIKTNVGANNYSPLQHKHQNGTSKTIGAIIRGYKIGVTKWMRNNSNIYHIWQRNYYEHIIRNETELNKIREYIINNSLKWDLDFENPERKKEYKNFTDYLKDKLSQRIRTTD